MKTFLFLLLVTFPCFANIGETPEQSIKRYGTPVLSKDESLNVPYSKWMSFDHVPYQIIVRFYQDKCANLSFTKMENADGKTWGQPTTDSVFTVWTRSNGVTASYSHDSTHSLMFEADKNKKQDSSTAAKP
jgi:hypothetical protein